MEAAAAVFGQEFVQDDAGQRLAAAVTAWAQIDILVLKASIELPEISRRFPANISIARSPSTCAPLWNCYRPRCRPWPNAVGFAFVDGGRTAV